MNKDEALKLALEALKHTHPSALTSFYTIGDRDKAIKAIQEHLAQPEQEPVGLIESLKDAKPCCGEYETCWRACTPRGKFLGQRDAQRTWVGLTDAEVKKIVGSDRYTDLLLEVVNFVEVKLKEKNT